MPDTISLMPGGLRERALGNITKHRHRNGHQQDIPVASITFVHIPTRPAFLGELDYNARYGDEIVMHNNYRFNSLCAHERFTVEVMHGVLGILRQVQ